MGKLEQIIDWAKQLDADIVLFINGLNHPVLDEIMWGLTGKFIWFPLYLFLFYLVYRKTSIRSFLLFAVIGIAFVGLADFIATHGFKYNFERFRPSHHLHLKDLLHFYEKSPGDYYQGGQYGFVSGHATNSFMIAIYFSLFLRNYYSRITLCLVLWAVVVCYTRIYLGVHYLTDIIGGMILGISLAFLGSYLYKKLALRIKPQE